MSGAYSWDSRIMVLGTAGIICFFNFRTGTPFVTSKRLYLFMLCVYCMLFGSPQQRLKAHTVFIFEFRTNT